MKKWPVMFFRHASRRKEMEHLVTTGKIDGKRSRGRQREMLDSIGAFGTVMGRDPGYSQCYAALSLVGSGIRQHETVSFTEHFQGRGNNQDLAIFLL